MDDGSRQNEGLHLNTYGFTEADVLRLMAALRNLFSAPRRKDSLECSIHHHPPPLY